MAIGIRPPTVRPRRGRAAAIVVGAFAVLVAGIAAAVVLGSGTNLTRSATALAQVRLQPFAGSLVRATVTDPTGKQIPVDTGGDTIVPRVQLTPGELVTVDAVVRPPSLLRWALGSERHQRITVRAPVARITNRFITTAAGSTLSLTFDQPVSAVAYGPAGNVQSRAIDPPRTSIVIPRTGSTAGVIDVAVAARSWESAGRALPVTWFPSAATPVAVVSPAPGAQIAPTDHIRLTFSRPIAAVLGAQRPTITPATPGKWRAQDGHTLVFTPSGVGAGLAIKLHVHLPVGVAIAGPASDSTRLTSEIEYTTPLGSTLRLQQLLAQAGYLPVNWAPSGPEVAKTTAAEVAAAITPPLGTFDWRYTNTPPELRKQWAENAPSNALRGAVMMFQAEHGLATDGVAGNAVWRALLADAVAGRRHAGGYSYVYVHRDLPQRLILWHDGRTILRSPGNTGVPAAPTKLGTFPVFEHIASGTMKGTNPDGSTYNDPGIKWISYFNGGDALHAFPRASFGTPQSLGCVELPLATAAQVWPYTPIGTLVTVEH